MAGRILVVRTTEIALVAATAKTVLQLRNTAASAVNIKIIEWGVYFDGVSVTGEPVQVDVIRVKTASGEGTQTQLVHGTDTNFADVNLYQAATVTIPAPLVLVYNAATIEPTNTSLTIVDGIECHPQQGYEKLFPLGQEIMLPIGARMNLVCTAPANVNVKAKFKFEE